MWWAGSEVHAYVTEGGSWVSSSGQPARALATEGWRAGLAAVAAEASSKRASTLRLWLGGELARPFVMEPIAGLRNRREALHMAQAQAAELMGLREAPTIWLDRWLMGQRALVVAVETALVEEASAYAERAGLRLKELAPAWNTALTKQLAHGKAETATCLVVIERSALTVLGMSSGRFDFGQTVTPAPAADRLDAQLLRLAVGHDTPIESFSLVCIAGLKAGNGSQPAGISLEWRNGR